MRIRCLLVFVFSAAVMLAPGLSFGQEAGLVPASRGTSAVSKDNGLEQQLLRLNREMLDAQIRGDIAALDQFLTDDFTRTHAAGGVQSKADFLSSDVVRELPGAPVGSPKMPRFLAFDLSNVKVRLYGTSAILTAQALVKRAGDPDDHTTFLNVWVLQDGKWRVAAWVTTRIPQRAAEQGAGK